MSLENVLELGKSKLKSLLAGKQEAEEVKKEEEKQPEETPEPKEKTEEEIQAEESEDDNEEELLEKPEDQLEEEEKTKVEEIKEKRKGEPTDKQTARKLRKAEKKISKMFGKLQDLDRSKSSEVENLESEIAELKKQIAVVKQPVDENDAAQAEQARILKEIEEDKGKSYADRREMTKEDWEVWFDEDPQEAQRWVTKNENRRLKLTEDSLTKQKQSEKAEEFIAEQDKSVNRLMEKFPNVRPKEKVLELKEKGLNQAEIQTILETEYPEYAICDTIVKENPKWLEGVDFGDKVLAELEKRLIAKKETKSNPKMYSEEEVEKIKEETLKSEQDRRNKVDVSNSSTIGGHVITKIPQSKTEEVAALEALYKKAGLDPKLAKGRLETRKNMGLGNYDPKKDVD